MQHGLSPESLRDHMSPLTQHPLHRTRGRDLERNLHHSRDRDRSRESRDASLEMRESLLGQALEGGPTLIVPSSQVITKYLSFLFIKNQNFYYYFFPESW